jgi:hypothetical protein
MAYAAAQGQTPVSPALPIVALLAAAFVWLLARVNAELVNLASHLARTAAAVGRALFLIALVATMAVLLLLHLLQR